MQAITSWSLEENNKYFNEASERLKKWAENILKESPHNCPESSSIICLSLSV